MNKKVTIAEEIKDEAPSFKEGKYTTHLVDTNRLIKSVAATDSLDGGTSNIFSQLPRTHRLTGSRDGSIN